MVYDILYEHLEDDLVTNEDTRWCFNQVKKIANKYKLELSDDDFNYLFKLKRADEDIEWIMHKMSVYKITLVDALISYITY